MAIVAAIRLVGSVISRQEILDFAVDFGLDANVVEKDYALGWLLAGFGEHAATRDAWLFKGGTCLKKCFFETYRFSEDLDFTLLDSAHLDSAFLAQLFQEVADWVYENSGLTLPADARRIDVHDNGRGGRSAEGRMGYRGPLGRTGDAPRIKLDLTDHERVVMDPDRREVHHPYSDRPTEGIWTTTYRFEEIFAEKVRALAERLRPRDLYDVVHLHRRRELAPDRAAVLATLRQKCDFKGIAVPTLQSIRESQLVGELKVSWDQMLRHQLPALPSFNSFWNELPDVFSWLFEEQLPPTLTAISVANTGQIDSSWHAPNMATSWRGFGTSAPMEIVRFAAANRLCVELDYRDEQGRRSSRVIEPYSLRRTSAGHILLLAVKADSGEPRSYRLDRILGAKSTGRQFIPRFLVELSDGQPLVAPLARREPRVSMGSARRAAVRARPAESRGVAQAKHIFRCTVCGRNFTKTRFNASLNSHKGRNGRPCMGRVGAFVRTKH